MTIEKIITAVALLNEFVKEDRSKGFTLSGVTRMKVADNLVSLHRYYKTYDEERIALIKKLGTPDKDNPNNISIPEETDAHKEFASEIKEMLASERAVEIDPLTRQEVNGSDKNPNQVSIDLLTNMIEHGIVVKNKDTQSA